jgi:transposase
VLVTNQRRETGQSVTDYLDWMVCVYKNHRHVERRMWNLKSDLPIRPIYLHRDDAIVALCFVNVVA